MRVAQTKEVLSGRFGVFGIVPECALAPFMAKVETPLDGRPGTNPFKPVPEAGKVFELLALVFVWSNPAPTGPISADHVRYRVVTAEISRSLRRLFMRHKAGSLHWSCVR